MKATKYFFGLLALALCAACSDSETVDSALETDADGNTYMTISVSMGVADTRASQSYETGDKNETYVDASKSVLLFYDTYGSYMAYGMLTEDLTWSSSTSTGLDQVTVVVYGLSVKPTQVFAVFNYSNYSSLLNKSLSDVITITTSTTPSSKGDFLMTNALRVVKGEFVRAAELDASYIYSTEAEAKAGTSAATIFVEREIAKVDVDVQTASEEEGYFQYDEDSTYYAILPGNYTYGYLDTLTYKPAYVSDVKAKVVIKGWAINATNDEGYITKNYNSDRETALSQITDDDEYSYWVDSSTQAYLWAVDANYDYDADNDDYTIGTTSSAGSGTSGSVFDGVTYLTWNEVFAKGCSTDAAYYHENTADAAAQAALNQSGTKACTPTITLATQLLVDTDGDGTYSTSDFQSNNIYYRNGTFYSNYAVGALAMTQLSDYYLSSDGGTTFISSETNYFVYFTDATLELVAHDNNSFVQIGSLALYEGITAWYSEDGTTTNAVQVDLDDENDEEYQALLEAINSTEILKIDGDEGLECFYLGYCYYQAPIEQISYTSGSSEITYNGIVRNHSYHLTLNSVSELGQGVFDPDEEIVVIPGDEEKYYLSCTVNILQWVAKSQSVDF